MSVIYILLIGVFLSSSIQAQIIGQYTSMAPIADEIVDDIIADSIITNAIKNDAADVSFPTAENLELTELKCLTQTIYYEARGEGHAGKVAVGNVVMNRVQSKKFPNSICKVMHQRYRGRCQFSFVCDNSMAKKTNPRQWYEAKSIAQKLIQQELNDYSNGGLFFHANYAKIKIPQRRYTAKIGHHYFYR